MPDWPVKQQRVRRFLEEKGLDGFVFSLRSSFAWLTDGGESSVDESVQAGAADLVFIKDRAYVIAPNNEMDRLLDEVLGDQGYEPVVYSWRGDRISVLLNLLKGKNTGSDTYIPGCREMCREVKALRFELLPEERIRMRRLGEQTSEIVGLVLAQIRPGQTEAEVAGELKAEMAEAGIASPVVLVASDGRLKKFRHPLPTEKRIEKMVMAIVCARRWGLTVALTRMVHFGSLPEDLKKRHNLVSSIEAELIASTVPGARIKEIFHRCCRAYENAGYPGEWEKHHQGGAIGYDTREYLAGPDCGEAVRENQGFAWNPFLKDVKSEDTIIASLEGPEVITLDKNWPVRIFEKNGYRIPTADILSV
ncbi:M24 family metallopeptidase [Thermoanaerobacterium sp. DL9XJH110]|uniref:M24 family metallopeptidase n=1 Tax=Thermoanaerobacterium sp. DL9XJH110 TaxID=3386643 RepID=UPI003BB507DC